MADFLTALTPLLVNEGTWSDDRADRGGETCYGISRKKWPAWEGWAVVDTLRGNLDFPSCLDDSKLLQLNVQAFYKLNFWHFDKIADQSVATKVLDMCVNFGQAAGIGLLQHALASRWGFACNQDCKYGPLTEAFVARAHAPDLLNELRFQMVRKYVSIVVDRPAQMRFIEGWLRRGIQ